MHERERKLGLRDKSLLAVAYEYGVPIYTSSPGDSSIGMNVAAKALQGNKLAFDPSLDVNETAAIVLAAKRDAVSGKGRGTKTRSGRSAVFILGGGSPKNFLLQTEPQIQEVLGIDERGHDYFLRLRTRDLIPAVFPEPRRRKQSRGARSIPIACPMRLYATLIRRWHCRSLRLMLSPSTRLASQSVFTTAAASSWICF